MTMFDFMANAFYMLCGVLCVAVSVLVLYCVIISILRTIGKGNKNGRKAGNQDRS